MSDIPERPRHTVSSGDPECVVSSEQDTQSRLAMYLPHVAHARTWCEQYFALYNFEHHHCGLAGHTPEQVFTSRYNNVVAAK